MGVLLIVAAAGAGSCQAGKDGGRMTESTTIKLVLEKELPGRLTSCPLLRRGGPNGTSWSMTCAALEPRASQKGQVTVVLTWDVQRPSAAPSALRDFEVPPGCQLGAGDVDGDRRDELIVVDLEGRVRVYNGEGRMRAGFPTPASPGLFLLGPPAVSRLGDSALGDIVCLSGDVAIWGSTSQLSVIDAAGKPRPPFPITLSPPAARPPVFVSQGRAGPQGIVFAQRDGAVASIGLDGKVGRLGGLPGNGPPAWLAAADVNGDGADEILLAYGGHTIQCVQRTGRALAPWPLRLEGAAFTAVAAGTAAGGKGVVCAYDQTAQQFLFMDASARPLRAVATGRRTGCALTHLSALQPPSGEGCLFVALVYCGGSQNVDAAFCLHATPEMRQENQRYAQALRASSRDREPLNPADSRDIETNVREYKWSQLVTQFGQKKADELVSHGRGTEVWVFDSAGRLLGSKPLVIPALHPFVDQRGKIAAPPATRPDGRAGGWLLLMGLNDPAGGNGRLMLYSIR